MENIIGHWLLNSPEGRKIIKKSKNVSDLKNNVNEYIIKNDIIATPMGSVKDIKTVKDWEHIYKNTKFSYKDGGSTSLGVVTIKFDNPKYNYTTNVSSSTTEAEARKFFVGKMFDVGSYPKENMQKVIDIDFSKSDDKMKTGGEVKGLDKNKILSYYRDLREIADKEGYKSSKIKLSPELDTISKFSHNGNDTTYIKDLIKKEESKYVEGGRVKGFEYTIGGL